jgi:hypothetical protein
MNPKLHVSVLVLGRLKVDVGQLVTQIKCNVVVMPCIEHGCANDQLASSMYTKFIRTNYLLSMERKHIHRYKYIGKMFKIVVGRFSCNH